MDTLRGSVKEQKPSELLLSLLGSDILAAAPPADLAGPAGVAILTKVDKINKVAKVELQISVETMLLASST